MDKIAPSLDASSVERLARLTSEYARLSTGHAGLASLLAGGFLLGVAGVELQGHGWRLAWLGAFAPLPIRSGVLLALLPFLWLLARVLLRHLVQGRFGAVQPVCRSEDPRRARLEAFRRRAGRVVLPCLLLLTLVPILAMPMSHRPWRAALVVLLAGGLSWAFPGLEGRRERVAAVLLFLAPPLVLGGIQMAAGDTLLAYPLVGTLLVVLGIRDHVCFRRLVRELADPEASR